MLIASSLLLLGLTTCVVYLKRPDKFMKTTLGFSLAMQSLFLKSTTCGGSFKFSNVETVFAEFKYNFPRNTVS